MSHICQIYVILTGQLCVSSAFHCTEWFILMKCLKYQKWFKHLTLTVSVGECGDKTLVSCCIFNQTELDLQKDP